MARNRSENFELTNLKQIIEDALVLLERELSKYRIAVETNLTDVPPVLAMRPGRRTFAKWKVKGLASLPPEPNRRLRSPASKCL